MTDHKANLAHRLEPASPEKTVDVEEIDTQSTADWAIKSVSLAESPVNDASQASIQATDGYSDSGSQHGHCLPELYLYSQLYPAGPVPYEHSQDQADLPITSQPTALQNHSGNLIYPSFGRPVSGYCRYPYDPRMVPQYTSTEQSMTSFNCHDLPQHPQQGYVAYPMRSHSQPTPPYARGPMPYSPPNHTMHSQDNNALHPTTTEANVPSKAGPTRVKEKGKYQCEVCAKHFLRPSALVVHTRSHSGERPYSCGFLGCRRGPQNGFSVLSNKTRHEKSAHKAWYEEKVAKSKVRAEIVP